MEPHWRKGVTEPKPGMLWSLVPLPVPSASFSGGNATSVQAASAMPSLSDNASSLKSHLARCLVTAMRKEMQALGSHTAQHLTLHRG